MSAPAWMLKHPCTGCGAGYGICSQGGVSGYQCCKSCDHPGRRVKYPYTATEWREMWEGHEKDRGYERYLKELEEHGLA